MTTLTLGSYDEDAIKEILREGLSSNKSHREIAKALNEKGLITSHGRRFHHGLVGSYVCTFGMTKRRNLRIPSYTKEVVMKLRRDGIRPKAISSMLNEAGETRPTGEPWSGTAISELIKRERLKREGEKCFLAIEDEQ